MGKSGLTSIMLLALVCTLAFQHSYKGLSHALYSEWRYGSWRENYHFATYLLYWLEFMEKLSERDGYYDFYEGESETALSDFERGKLAYHRGQFAEGVQLIDADIAQNGSGEQKLFWLAMCLMRQGEEQNCLVHLVDQAQRGHDEHAQLCTLPLTRFHRDGESARRAAQVFAQLLDEYDADNRLYQWLMFFNYMTIDAYPDQVPERHRSDSVFIDAFYSAGAPPAGLAFRERAAHFAVDTNDTGRGVAVEDFDGDGFLDIATGGSFGRVRYYKNLGGHFAERTAEAGLDDIEQPFVLSAADYDNDGRPDLFVCRPFHHFELYRNQGDGTFVDVTRAVGLAGDDSSASSIALTWIPAWGDIDNDGDIDLFLAQWSFALPFLDGLLGKERSNSTLYLNDNGRFVDRTHEFGLDQIVDDLVFVGAAFGDYDRDGYADLFLSSTLRNTSALLRNIGGTRFEPSQQVRRSEGGMTASFIDANHDGLLDIFWGGFGNAHTLAEQVVFGQQHRSGHTTLLRQQPDGTFAEDRDFFDMPISTMGASYGDLNNDGCHDFYLGTGNPEGWFVMPNLMYLSQSAGNDCAPHADNISMYYGFGTIQKGHGIVFFDFDNDGDQDIYSSLGGMWPADAWPNQFFVNESPRIGSWVKIRLRGRQTNRFGIGAMICVRALDAEGQTIVRYYHMDNKTGFGSAPYLAHIGLGNAVKIAAVEVQWPGSGHTKTYAADLGGLYTLDEGAGSQQVPLSAN